MFLEGGLISLFLEEGGPTSSLSTVKCCVAKHNGDKGLGNSQSAPSSVVAGSTFQGILDPDLETTLSQNVCSADASVHDKDNKTGMATTLPNNETSFDGCVADDSQTEDNDLYLSECRILVVGFEAAEMRKLVNLVRRGGGSRYMSFNEKLTHIVVGNPSEIEKKEVRCLSALGVINVVKSIWLEDCERQRKEIPVLRRHIADDLLLPKDAIWFNKRAVSSAIIHKEGKGPTVQSSSPANQSVSEYKNFGSGISMEKSGESKLETNRSRESSKETSSRSVQQTRNLVANDKLKNEDFLEPDANSLNIEDKKASSVFNGLLFQFSNSFPEHRRAEVVEWVNQGGGEVVDDMIKQEVHYTVECHGLMPRSGNVSNVCVSTHWIRSCIKDGRLLDVGSHILYSPLPCQIPLPGFESFRFCVSQYEERERNLLRNLCFVLGSKYADTLSKKVTHLICKFTTGPKYEAACKRGIKSVTSEWIYACVKQNQIVDLSPFFPKEATMKDHEAGFCTVSQYPTQAARMLSNEDPSQLLSQTQNLRNLKNQVIGHKNGSFEEVAQSSSYSKRARLSEHGSCKGRYPSRSYRNDPINGVEFSKNTMSEDIAEVSPVPDVAAAIEDLLEQTSKIQDLQLPERTACDKSVSVQLSSSDCSTIGQDHVDPHPSFMLSKHWLNRTEKKVDLSSNLPGDAKASVYDTYNETPTESQVVSYEEDLSGRQMIIDRVRTQSSRPAS